MDPFEPIFFDSSNGVRPKTFIYTDMIDDGAVHTDMTWSSLKISNEIRAITQRQIIPKNIGIPGQILAMDEDSDPMWMDLEDIVHMMTNEEIDAIFSSPDMGELHLPSLRVANGVLYVDGLSYANH